MIFARWTRIAAAAALGAAAALAALAAGAGAAVIDSAAAVARGPVVELRFGVRGKGFGCTLSAHGNELWLDLANTRIDLPPRPLYGRERAPVVSVRAIEPGGSRSRLVIQVAGKTDYAVGKFPHELLIRLAPAGEAPNLAAPVLVRTERRGGRVTMGRPPAAAPRIAAAVPPLVTAAGQRPSSSVLPLPASAVVAAPTATAADAGGGVQLASAHPPAPKGRADTLPPQGVAAPLPPAAEAAASEPVVVIDPGHGGYDSGTEVGAPLLEKDLALQIAIRLQAELERRRVRAILTRTGDYFVTLADRTAFANKEGADLFISIHLNSSPDAGTAGIETYYLNNTTDRATIRLAAMENASGGAYSTAAGSDLNYILSDMRQQYKANESVALASMIEAQTAADINASLGVRVTALGAMRGPFYVLVGARMPAVLVECGFLSNRDEAARLASARYQEVLAQGIAEAAVHYFNADAAVGNL
ncbi:MAG TPA: N-acetylmuramoyl-L-alanine amidase [Candidatus Binataceae bacterium]